MASLQNTRVLVTGAAGFIGSHLTERLVRTSASVRAFVRYNSRNDYGWLEELPADVRAGIEVFRGDLANPEAVVGAVAGCDVIFHLGALIPIPYSYRHPREYVTVNVEGTLNVLEAARRSDIRRVVHTSTSEVYGSALTPLIDEEHPLNAQSPYAATKVGADKLALSFQLSFGTPVVVARPFNTYGPRQSARAVIPTVISQALTRDRISLGSLEPTRDFTYVDDTVSGFIACAITDGIDGEVINFGTGVEYSVADVVERVLAILGKELPVEAETGRKRPGGSEVERLQASNRKARELIGWAPEVGFDEGLRRTVDWVAGSLDRFKPEVYNI